MGLYHNSNQISFVYYVWQLKKAHIVHQKKERKPISHPFHLSISNVKANFFHNSWYLFIFIKIKLLSLKFNKKNFTSSRWYLFIIIEIILLLLSLCINQNVQTILKIVKMLYISKLILGIERQYIVFQCLIFYDKTSYKVNCHWQNLLIVFMVVQSTSY